MVIIDILKSFGIGLSRVIRYTYLVFLFIVAFALVDPGSAKLVFIELGWELSALIAVFTGVGIYTIHRSFIIPFHHLIGCFFLWIGDKICKVSLANSLSPTRWLRTLNVPEYRLMLAYGDLRKWWFSPPKERDEINVNHAESGIPVMISEAIIVASVYSWDFWLYVGGISLFLLSVIPAMQHHRIECAHFKIDINRAKMIVNKFSNQ
ncbi:MAG: hypothetical protein KKD86_11420 [Bacteroidetes bacterium]|nr:hypothetical protein [Bacteroidota bacterium]